MKQEKKRDWTKTMADNNYLSCKIYYFVHKNLVLSNELTKVELIITVKEFHGFNSTYKLVW